MTHNHDRLLYLFDRLSHEQQQDLMNLMETWHNMPRPAEHAGDTALNPALADSIGQEWKCLNALKKVVNTHFPARLELAYLAFNPDLDSVSTAKSRRAAEEMYTLEAAYELKRILEADPTSELFNEDISEFLHRCLAEGQEQK